MRKLLLLSALLLAIVACRRSESDAVVPAEAEAFMPLQVGNYWKVNDKDYLEVTGDTTLNGQRYFVIRSVQNGSFGLLYFRLDGGRRLTKIYPITGFTSIVADFGLPMGQTSQEGGEQPTLVEKTADRVTFRYPCMACSAFGVTYDVVFQRGRGWLRRGTFTGGSIRGGSAFTEIRINGTVYRQ